MAPPDYGKLYEGSSSHEALQEPPPNEEFFMSPPRGRSLWILGRWRNIVRHLLGNIRTYHRGLVVKWRRVWYVFWGPHIFSAFRRQVRKAQRKRFQRLVNQYKTMIVECEGGGGCKTSIVGN